MGNWKKLLDKLEHGKKNHKPMEHSKTLLEGVLNQFIDTSDENELTIYKDAIYKHFDKFEMWYLMHNGLKLNILVCILFHRAILHLHKETERLFKEIKWIFEFRFIWQKYEGCLAVLWNGLQGTSMQAIDVHYVLFTKLSSHLQLYSPIP